jgi:enamine deaminase RidA (YjgF/YER057c/UK114 family)
MYGYCRAVRVGDQIHVSGTTAEPAVAEAGAGMYEQAASALGRIVNALAELDASPADVVRTVAYTTDVTRFEEVARAHRGVFGDVRPAGTLVEVGNFVSPIYLVEIEAYAVVTPT